MSQPPGFVDPLHKDHVYKLHRSLYGLKQSLRAWFRHLSDFITTLGFTRSTTDPSLFIRITPIDTNYILVYVDEIILTGSSSTMVHQIIQMIGAEFALKDLGSLHYFLDIEVTNLPSSLLLSQSHYISDLLLWANMDGCKLVATLMSSSTKLSISSRHLLADPLHY